MRIFVSGSKHRENFVCDSVLVWTKINKLGVGLETLVNHLHRGTIDEVSIAVNIRLEIFPLGLHDPQTFESVFESMVALMKFFTYKVKNTFDLMNEMAQKFQFWFDFQNGNEHCDFFVKLEPKMVIVPI